MNFDHILFPELDADIQHFSELYPNSNISMESDFYDMDKINALSIKNYDFTLFSHNCRSLSGHYDAEHALKYLPNLSWMTALSIWYHLTAIMRITLSVKIHTVAFQCL